MRRTLAARRSSGNDAEISRGPASFGDMFFGFLDESEQSPESSCNSGDSYNDIEDDEDETSFNVEENKAFWESQDELIKAMLRRTSSIESKIRQATKDAIREFNLENLECGCRRPVAGGCRNCLQREICKRLINMGYDCAICKSKWERLSDIPSGEHSYLQVVDNSNPKKGEVGVIIEPNFRAEFEMARASEQYNRLISRLPEVFIGKSARLHALIKILCSCAKKCMKEKKMYLAPWRRQKYMQAKWLGRCERTTRSPLSVGFSVRPPKTKVTSMLTFDLIENLSGLHCSAVEVV